MIFDEAIAVPIPPLITYGTVCAGMQTVCQQSTPYYIWAKCYIPLEIYQYIPSEIYTSGLVWFIISPQFDGIGD